MKCFGLVGGSGEDRGSYTFVINVVFLLAFSKGVVSVRAARRGSLLLLVSLAVMSLGPASQAPPTHGCGSRTT